MIRPKKSVDVWFVLPVVFLVTLGLVVLSAIAPAIFPTYYFYIVIGLLAFVIFASVDLEIFLFYSKQLFIISVALLTLPPLIGQVTRGVVRWIPIGALTIQPSELVRPFVLLFFAQYFTSQSVTVKRLFTGIGLFAIPFILIVLQPSLGVAVLTGFGFLGVLLATDLPKKYFLYIVGAGIAALPLVWLLLAPYQRSRVMAFVNPATDPLGSGYNSIQSTISVGSGGLTGRGLGKGVQTQLNFLPERQTDFMFASISEELGFVGAGIVLVVFFVLLMQMARRMENARSPATRAFVAGFLLSFFAQTLVHVGMNMALFPITGIPLPLVSAGGSSFMATMMGLGLIYRARPTA